MTDLHPIKKEIFDTTTLINIDPKGIERQVDIFRNTNDGLYMARGANHPQFGYLESWLLPRVGLRANIFHYRPNIVRREDLYFDLVSITEHEGIWQTRDLYLDLLWTRGNPVRIDDVDELMAAIAAGFIDAVEAEKAINNALSAVDGIARNDDDPLRWLSAIGFNVSWAQDVTLMPAQ
ncbi:DUF402 domain-containing protein [Corynebacterium sp. sy039]|uniref:DUF402 domain-containing protein n=1 Tax=Corynebacterium sp. sy039 TaxID=2599641 RepID=UPI0011B7F75F|nr:DUF402 domain-containing protein [Corynebacterium sp. sy039]QDZ43508.1 DUF402 domain-containing protein [Corynebacterium sp. sy039]